jgi:DNA-binding MarR family transcriptional regulator
LTPGHYVHIHVIGGFKMKTSASTVAKLAAANADRAACIVVARECTAASLRRASRAIGRIYDEVMAPTGLRGTQFSLLVALSLTGDVAVARLADELGLDRTTLTRNLAPLERDGLVASVAGADRRVRMVRLTAEGRRLLGRVLPLWRQAQERVVAGLGKPRWQTLLDGLAATAALADIDGKP